MCHFYTKKISNQIINLRFGYQTHLGESGGEHEDLQIVILVMIPSMHQLAQLTLEAHVKHFIGLINNGISGDKEFYVNCLKRLYLNANFL